MRCPRPRCDGPCARDAGLWVCRLCGNRFKGLSVGPAAEPQKPRTKPRQAVTTETAQTAQRAPEPPPGKAFRLGEVWEDVAGRRHRVGPCSAAGLVTLTPIDHPKLAPIAMDALSPYPWRRVAASG